MGFEQSDFEICNHLLWMSTPAFQRQMEAHEIVYAWL